MASRLSRHQQKFLNTMQQESKSLEAIILQLNTQRHTINRWLRNKEFMKDLRLIIDNIRRLHRVQNDLNMYRASRLLSEQVNAKKPDVALLHKVNVPLKRPARPKRKEKKKPAMSTVHPDVGKAEASELQQQLRGFRGETSQN